ncbi:MAG: DUF4374 domain-containing protein [Pedobacter sp.]|nr:MAG: DUF4374 domain-containing protein [Pedobacter sp.]
MKTNKIMIYAASALLFMAACKKDEAKAPIEVPQEPVEGKFIVTALPYMSYIFGNGADLLYTTNSLDEGTLATTGKGVEQDGTSRNYVTSGNTFFSLLFGQGNPGAVTAYTIDGQAQLTKKTNFQSETMTAFGAVGDDIVMFKNAWEPTTTMSKWYRVSAKSLQIVAQGEINTNTLTGNGEMALFTSVKKVGDKVFAPFLSMKTGRSFATAFPDNSWIAVFKYPEMTLEKVIKDDRTGAIGAYFSDMLEVDENGDAYAIGTSLGTASGTPATKNSTKPVAIMKIKKGTTDYDKSYFFNISEVSGNNYVFRKLYLGKGNFLLMMADALNVYANNAKKFAIANVYDKSFKWVTGAPVPASIMAITEYSGNYSPLDGKTGYIGVVTSDGNDLESKVLKFDATTGTATVGLKLEGQYIIRSINWVPVTK